MGFNVELHYPELKKRSGLDTFDYMQYDGQGLTISPSYSTRVTCNASNQANEITAGTAQ